MTSDSSRPIGMFDSGIGGLSVARWIMSELPAENTIYFGDSARVPYGTKSPETVLHYTRQAVAFLDTMGVKMIIIACNTASAVALDYARSLVSIPVIGVILPGAASAAETTRNGTIGVMGTEGTVRSGAYASAVKEINADFSVVSVACPLLVAFAEEGLVTHPATRLVLHDYLEPLTQASVDAIVLGCTHYPLLQQTIQEIVGNEIALIDPGYATARHAADILRGLDLLNPSTLEPIHRYFLSDLPHKFIEIGERFLGSPIRHVEKISLESLEELM